MPEASSMQYRTLGRTGERVSLVGLGGYHVGRAADEQTAIAIVRTALDRGLNFMDNCWSYHEGRSEVLMGKALRDGYRAKAFLMSKIDARTRKVALGQIDESLRRLQTDVIDLVQIHEVVRMEDPDWCFAPDGAIEGLVEARRLGKIRYIGFTGHKDPAMHLKMLATARAAGFAFDTVQMPLSVLDHHYENHSFERQVLPVLVAENVGVLGMKPLAQGRIPESGAVSAVDCLRYALSLPTSVVITGCDSLERLEQAIQTAVSFQPLTPAETADILARTRDLGKLGDSEPWKTTTNHDGTSRNPDWMWERVAWA